MSLSEYKITGKGVDGGGCLGSTTNVENKSNRRSNVLCSCVSDTLLLGPVSQVPPCMVHRLSLGTVCDLKQIVPKSNSAQIKHRATTSAKLEDSSLSLRYAAGRGEEKKDFK